MSDGAIKVAVFDCDDAGTLVVYPRCECGRYLKHGTVSLNGMDEVKTNGWICSRCGEVTPLYEFIDPADLIRTNQ